ncbi:MAG: hypothetical protein ACI81R_003579 [Bradymonadia bacterium]|jgi:hypothetical protein
MTVRLSIGVLATLLLGLLACSGRGELEGDSRPADVTMPDGTSDAPAADVNEDVAGATGAVDPEDVESSEVR